MEFTVKVNLDNDAFQEGNLCHQLSAILSKVSYQVKQGIMKYNIQDVNGNRVGEYFIDSDALSEGQPMKKKCATCGDVKQKFATKTRCVDCAEKIKAYNARQKKSQ